MPTPRRFDTLSCVVEAKFRIERYEVVALVVVELRRERLVMVEEAEFTRSPEVKEVDPSKVAVPVTVRLVVVASVAVSEVRVWLPEIVMSFGMSESVSPVIPETETLERVTLSSLSIFWVREIILVLESLREETEESWERREERELFTSLRIELLRALTSANRESRTSESTEVLSITTLSRI